MINKNIIIENARIGFRNFSGNAGKFNPEGRRNFCVFLEYDLGKVLEQDGRMLDGYNLEMKMTILHHICRWQ